MSRLRIIVTGLIAQHPRLGGVAWDYLQYLLGFERLGHAVTYIEDSGQWPYVFEGNGKAKDGVANASHLDSVLRRYGFRGAWGYRCGQDGQWFGLSELARKEAIGSADLLVNVSGSMIDPAPYSRVPVRAFIDSDPAFTQIRGRSTSRLRKLLLSCNVHFTFGETLGAAGVPLAGIQWLPTRSPIIPDLWSRPAAVRPVFTTVMSWASYQPISYRGNDYGQKDVEFAKFLDLPALTPGVNLEVACHPRRHKKWEWPDEPDDESPLNLLEAKGWKLANSLEVAGDPERYRDYILGSQAEWSVAKNGYVTGRTGWFSCRSGCYLAAGRPVVLQDTGFSKVIPCGLGVLAFEDLPSAVGGIESVRSDYGRHARAARELAREYFESGKVLGDLLDRAFQMAGYPEGVAS